MTAGEERRSTATVEDDQELLKMTRVEAVRP